ncbi:hypothetical protein ABZ733_09390 [Streptomyces longwoodensis]|uniref:hypothetical protein n=1 Tax=Streptomyces longwoodensis TaxID=68231 RepID=UPI0033D6E10F
MHHGVDLPERMRPQFARIVQRATDDSGREATREELYALFRAAHLDGGPVRLASWSCYPDGPDGHRFTCTLETEDGTTGARTRGGHQGTGGAASAAFADALADGTGRAVDVLEVVGRGGLTFAECRVDGVAVWGAGEGATALEAGVRAVLSAVNGAPR